MFIFTCSSRSAPKPEMLHHIITVTPAAYWLQVYWCWLIQKNLRSFITVKAHCSVTHQKTAKIVWFFLVLHWAMYAIYDFYYIHGLTENSSGTQLYHNANFHADRPHRREISVPRQKRHTHQMIYPTKPILAVVIVENQRRGNCTSALDPQQVVVGPLALLWNPTCGNNNGRYRNCVPLRPMAL